MSLETAMTIQEFWEVPERPGVRLELINGTIVEYLPFTVREGLINRHVLSALYPFVRDRRLGFVCGNGPGFVLGENPASVRVPDTSFIARDRIPTTGIPDGFWPEAPDLAVEIVSPNDRAENVHAKVGEYLAAGTRAVWVFWPSTRTVTVHHASGRVQDLGPDRHLDGGDVLPGFTVQVGDLFAVDLGT